MKATKMKPLFLLIVCNLFFISANLYSQKKEIKKSKIPTDVVNVLNKYIEILTTSESVEAAAEKLIEIAGGNLLTPSMYAITEDVKMYSLKKDWQNAQLYSYPVKITRCILTPNGTDGYQETYIKGDWYKIWIDKKLDERGMPAPISIIKPLNGEPKIISNIGSL
ncbi:MAG: hypothetical protein PHC28_03825 [Flavobacterium sp.]|uniref:hypothetical protein n=1 Tax=Flavobacterium sp. TaxID=239 RepID=UPI0026316D28|nr:hypothetical protein [Flavobacterium sp.]MDD5149594.1 hypothetical protein [Flavobacterium sp.]